MLVFTKDFSETREFKAPPKKVITITDRNIKVSKAGYIYIQKYIRGVHIRISIKLKYTKDNMELIKKQVYNYIENELVRRGYIQQDIERNLDEYLHESMLYTLKDLVDIKESSFARYKTIMYTLQKIYNIKEQMQ